MTKEQLYRAFEEACGDDLAEKALLEMLENRLRFGPDWDLRPSETKHENWRAYCEAMGNCKYSEFDEPLLMAWTRFRIHAVEAFGPAAVLDFKAGFDRTLMDLIGTLTADLNYTLYECHN